MSSLQRKVELIHQSSERLLKMMPLTRDEAWWTMMEREVKLHTARTDELKKMVRKRQK